MKLKNITIAFAATLALGLAGCNKSEPAAGGAAKATNTTEAAAKAADTAKAADNSKTQALIDQAAGLVAANKYSDAAEVLKELDGQSLSTGQQSLVDGLKAQMQKAVAAKAAGSAGNLLK